LLGVGVYFAKAEVVYGNSVTGNASSATSLTFSATGTCTGNDALFVAFTTDSIRTHFSVTYDGISLTKVREQDLLTSQRISVWEMTAPTCGSAANVVITIVGGTADIFAIASFYSAVDQSAPVSSSVGATNDLSGGDLFLPIASETVGDRFVAYLRNTSGTVTSTTSIRQARVVIGGGDHAWFDAYASTTASVPYGFETSGIFEMYGIGVSVRQYAVVPPFATTSASTSDITVIADLGYKTLILFWIAFFAALWTFQQFMR